MNHNIDSLPGKSNECGKCFIIRGDETLSQLKNKMKTLNKIYS